MFNDIEFANPKLLYGLLVLPLVLAWHFLVGRKKVSRLYVSNIQAFNTFKPTWRNRIFPFVIALRLAILALIIIALARPQSSFKGKEDNVEGIDIVLAMDVSGSMLAEDFSPNRLEAAKKVAFNFIQGRPNDRIGLVIYSGETYTQCPLTIDHRIVRSQLQAIHNGMITDGTAIGDGLATAINRLKNSTAVSKTIILLTDGINNQGAIDPLTAADMAAMYGIRVYTIGVGTIGTAPHPVQTPFGKQYMNVEVQLDEPMLTQIAHSTSGKYFRATSNQKLKAIFEEIDVMEKTKIHVLSYEHKSDAFAPFLWWAMILLLFEMLLRLTVLKTLP